MKIVNREQFLSLPNGVVYSRYSGIALFGSIEVKVESLENGNWTYRNLSDSVDFEDTDDLIIKMIRAMNKGTSFRMGLDYVETDKDKQDLFAIYDKGDLNRLILALSDALATYE